MFKTKETKEEIINEIEMWEEHISDLEQEIVEIKGKILALKAYL